MKCNHNQNKLVLIRFLVFCFLLIFMNSLPGFTQNIKSEIYSQLKYRHIGPPGNRTAAVVGVPGNLLVYRSVKGRWRSSQKDLAF